MFVLYSWHLALISLRVLLKMVLQNLFLPMLLLGVNFENKKKIEN